MKTLIIHVQKCQFMWISSCLIKFDPALFLLL